MIHDDDHNKLNEFLAEVNKRLGSKLEMDLPRIVVIGVQSAGKSSVLNRVIGFIIFPQASGTTTTCPIILRVFKIPESEEEGIELDNFPDAGRISDNDEVMAKIANFMEKNGGKLVDTPIGVRVYSRTLLPFTVIDMPGITKLAEGLSEDDLIKLSLKYITEKNTKILAVTPANDDISNSVAIQLAQKVDPEGKRTLVVLTKIDMMEKGTNALDLLSGKLPSLKQKLEIVGLVNRSQADIKKGVTLALQLQNEQEFLKEHYTDLAEQNGIGYLQKRLNKLLMPHLVNWLPDQLIQWKEKLQLCIDRLAKHPQELPLNQELDFLYKIVRRFEDGMKTEIQGCTQHPELHYLYGGVRIKYVYQKRFYEGIVAAEKAAQNSITKEMISNAFMNTESYNSIRSYAEPVFRTLAKEEIIRLVEPALKCADEVFDEIVKIADRNLKEKGDKDLTHFPAVQDVLRQGVIGEATAKLQTNA
ncbi:unnamed protein product [Orchesella dallaii]|uniref:Dynamin-type G domain-containing protein n=1 Tax=Orchesella dallaii TaxID=48710 RepID=A0ABP1R6R3_9HEXA